MAKSNTNKLAARIDQIVNGALVGSMKQVRKNAQQDHYRVQSSVAQFFDMFASIALDTPSAPQLGIYTPTYAALSTTYASKKPAGAGFFKKTGDLQRDVRNLSNQTTNLLGKSSFYIEQTSRGAKKGFTSVGASVQSNKTGKFVSNAQGLKNFRVKVTHEPFSKVDSNFKPKKLERDVFQGAYGDIYAKLTNQQGKGKRNPYRPAFYSFMKWWMNKHLPEVIK